MIMKERALQSPIHVPFVFGANYKPMHYKCLRRRDCFCTSIPLDTPLARLVTADPGTEIIEHDLVSETRCLDRSERGVRGA